MSLYIATLRAVSFRCGRTLRRALPLQVVCLTLTASQFQRSHIRPSALYHICLAPPIRDLPPPTYHQTPNPSPYDNPTICATSAPPPARLTAAPPAPPRPPSATAEPTASSPCNTSRPSSSDSSSPPSALALLLPVSRSRLGIDLGPPALPTTTVSAFGTFEGATIAMARLVVAPRRQYGTAAQQLDTVAASVLRRRLDFLESIVAILDIAKSSLTGTRENTDGDTLTIMDS